MPQDNSIRKVLVLGSGALKIGEAGEFDYSGSQCLKALKEEGIRTVLINPNIATVQTSEGMADKIYYLPVTYYFVEKVIEKEKPDCILLSFGGQTALNCGVSLFREGVFQKYGVRVLGTPVEAIINTEDRDLFGKELSKIKVETARSAAVSSVEQALEAARKIGYPVMIRAAYALGGRGSGIVTDETELLALAKKAFSSLSQILVEECLSGWKEIEYEVVRDSDDHCITVCNMENFDPMGIHTGESIVVAPSQTLSNHEYHKLRKISIDVIRHIGIVGECNIQYALDPLSDDYRVIEVNARLSRSSALASKATGYPLAYIAAKLALGFKLTELQNKVTKVTRACFEPALNYIVVKMPRWDLLKFERVSSNIGTEMKSVGEVMSIGRTFEEALQKAIRMLDIGKEGITDNNISFDIEEELSHPTYNRLFAVANALDAGYSVEKISSLSGIDKWFICRIRNIVSCASDIKSEFNPEILLRSKQLGFSDKRIASIRSLTESHVRSLRKEWNILPYVKQIDTLAAEYPAKTNYLYVTYNGIEHDVTFGSEPVVVLGSGCYRIGSSVEFDWCCVNSVSQAKSSGYATVMINNNPETVSTDYDEADRLYFEELTYERILDIYELENPHGIILSMGGQTPNNMALKLSHCNVLGTNPKDVDKAEDRHKFSALCDKLGIDQPEWKELTGIKELKEFAGKVGYPVLIRPSYVLSGAAMFVVYHEEEIDSYLNKASSVSEYPIVISKFIEGAKEIEIDAVASKGDIILYAISEHIENAGVHSGDATLVLPPQKTYIETMRKIKIIAGKLARELNITGPFNVQFIAKDNRLKVIECNLRASRSFPFVSKVMKTNFIYAATKAILSQPVSIDKNMLRLDYAGVKAAQFSYSRLKNAFPKLGVEMGSTGEVSCLGEDAHEALLKSLISTGFVLPQKSILLVISGDSNRFRMLEPVKMLMELNYEVYAAPNTANFYANHGIILKMLHKQHEDKSPSIIEYIHNKKLDCIIHIEEPGRVYEHDDPYVIRRAAIDFSIPLIPNLQLARALIHALYHKPELKIKSWDEY